MTAPRPPASVAELAWRDPLHTTSLLRISLETGADLLNDVQTFVTAYMMKRFRPVFAQSLAIASWELVENGLQYGSVTGAVIFELFDVRGVPEIDVSNALVASRLARLAARIQVLGQDAEGVYQDEFRKSMTPNGPRAMLGLARIAHEARMLLSYETVGDRVHVRARCRA